MRFEVRVLLTSDDQLPVTAAWRRANVRIQQKQNQRKKQEQPWYPSVHTPEEAVSNHATLITHTLFYRSAAKENHHPRFSSKTETAVDSQASSYLSASLTSLWKPIVCCVRCAFYTWDIYEHQYEFSRFCTRQYEVHLLHINSCRCERVNEATRRKYHHKNTKYRKTQLSGALTKGDFCLVSPAFGLQSCLSVKALIAVIYGVKSISPDIIGRISIQYIRSLTCPGCVRQGWPTTSAIIHTHHRQASGV